MRTTTRDARRLQFVRGWNELQSMNRPGVMRTLRFTLVLLFALAGLPATAGAQNPQQRIDTALRRAEAAGIPVSLLNGKVAEGRAKGVSADRIATAVERRLVSLGLARDAMAGVPRTTPITAADLSVGADALEAGVDPAVLGRLTSTVPATQRAVAIAALTDLVSGGESSDRALARVTAALARGPEALRRLPGQSNRGNNGANGRGRAQGGPPASVPGPTERPGRGRGRENNPGKGNKP
jgi:hypothetical protein